MTAECIMCGKPAKNGILCEKCDKPRKAAPRQHDEGALATEPAEDLFPEAPVVKFPVESTSVALTNIREILSIARVPSLLLTSDYQLRYLSEEAAKLLDLAGATASPTLEKVEEKLGFKIPRVRETQTSAVEVAGQPVHFSVIPLSGGASGCAVILRPRNEGAVPTSYMAFVRETVLEPLSGLRESLLAASQTRGASPLLHDAASTLDQVLSSLELAPDIEEDGPEAGRPTPTVAMAVRDLSDRFTQLARSKSIQIQFDFPDVTIPFHDMSNLQDVLGILLENSFHYVPSGGQVVVGLRQMEHKGKSLLLFFVMDNGPIVPQELREKIFSEDFVWRPSSPDRAGRGLARCREFATTHGGSIWIESKTGKACTFFLRVRPDS